MELEGSALTLLATDRYRLALREMAWRPAEPDLSAHALVPAKTLADTAKTLGPLGGEVTIALSRGGVGEGMIGFSAGTRRTTSRLLDGELPNVRALFADHYPMQARVSVPALVEVVRRVSLVAERATPVRLTFSEDVLVVEAGGSEEARASEAMDAAFTGGSELTIAFNPQYLLDGLAALDAPQAVFNIIDPVKPTAISPGSEDGEILPGYRYLIMPIRLGR